MSQPENIIQNHLENTREMLSGSGYSDRAIAYFMDKKNMGSLPDADQVTELTGPCGDTMRIYLKMNNGTIEDAKIEVLGCPGAIASAMAAMDLIKGKTLNEVKDLKDRDIFRALEDIPDQKQHCIRLTNKTIQKAIEDFRSRSETIKGD
jgi:nitrogen fixation NifU-like protein